jgi:hypothetical protein
MAAIYFLPTAFLASAAATPLFGAIAVDMNDSSLNPAYGWSTDQTDRATAERVATEYCRQHAGKNEDCRPIVWFNGCGAYQNSRKTYGFGYGIDKAEATAKAEQMCNPDGELLCRLVIAVCNQPPETE